MEILEICMRTMYFQVYDKFYKQKDGLTKGRPLSPIGSNIFIETFAQRALTSVQH
jgi:hypothetical protein